MERTLAKLSEAAYLPFVVKGLKGVGLSRECAAIKAIGSPARNVREEFHVAPTPQNRA